MTGGGGTAQSQSECVWAARRAFDDLPEEWRRVLWHAVVEHRSHSSTARLVGLAPHDVADLTRRGLAALRFACVGALPQPEAPGCDEVLRRLCDGGPSRFGRRDAAHISGCAACASAAGAVRRVEQDLRSSFGPIVALPPGRRPSLGRAGRSPGDGRRADRHADRRADLGLRVAIPVLAAGAVVVAVVGGATVAHSPPERSSVTTSVAPADSDAATTVSASSTVAASTFVASTIAGVVPSTEPATFESTTAPVTSAALSPTPVDTEPPVPSTEAPPAVPSAQTIVTAPRRPSSGPSAPATSAGVTPPAPPPVSTFPPVTFPPITLPSGGPPAITLPEVAD